MKDRAYKEVAYLAEVGMATVLEPDRWFQACDDPALLTYFVAKVMQSTKGKADPKIVLKLFEAMAMIKSPNRKSSDEDPWL